MGIFLLIIIIIGIVVIADCDRSLRIVSIDELLDYTYIAEEYLDQQKLLVSCRNPNDSELSNMIHAQESIIRTRRLLIANKKYGYEYWIIRRSDDKY